MKPRIVDRRVRLDDVIDFWIEVDSKLLKVDLIPDGSDSRLVFWYQTSGQEAVEEKRYEVFDTEQEPEDLDSLIYIDTVIYKVEDQGIRWFEPFHVYERIMK